MEKPPKLKVDVELVVNDGSTDGNVANDADTANRPNPGDQTVAPGSAALPSTSSTSGTSGAAKDPLAERAAKKQQEQEFLAAYKKRELFIRVRFAVIAVLIVGIFSIGLDSFFRDGRNKEAGSYRLSIVILSSLIGERDLSNFLISYFPLNANDKNVSATLDNRAKIAESSIADLEKDGRTAIFSRLGAEQMLLHYGRRPEGLKYGDYLIAKYPDLPSNYCWRANVDFDRGDFAKAIESYDKFVAVLEKAPVQTQKSWREQISKAIWASIDSGRFDDARRFLASYKQFGGSEENCRRFQVQFLIAQYDQLDINNLKKTDLWNAALANHANHLLTEADKQVEQVAAYDFDKDAFSADIALRRQDADKMALILEPMMTQSWMRYQYNVSKAELQLSQNNPQAALTTASAIAGRGSSAELDLLLATALQRLHVPERAVYFADKGLEWYRQPSVTTGKFYLPLLTMKARALADCGKQDQALQLCDRVIAENPHMLGTRLLKMQILQTQHKSAEAAIEHQNISTELKALASVESNK